MTQTNRGENKIELQGRVAQAPEFSHRNHGVDYYRLPLIVPRLSGVDDVIPLILPQWQVNRWTPEEGCWIYAEGEVRSYNNKSGQGSRLVITVLVREMSISTQQEGINRLVLSGTLCKMPVRRRTPLGREICDLLLAVNRAYGRADYLPCIAWGTLAMACGEMEVGDGLSIEGRLQSRTYHKVVDGVETERVAYEVSVMNFIEA